MVDGPSAASPTDPWYASRPRDGHVKLLPWVLVPADDDTGAVVVEEEDARLRVRVFEQVVFHGEVEVRVP